MLLTINNQPADPDLLARMRALTTAPTASSQSALVDAILGLREVNSDTAFDRRYLDLLQATNAIETVMPQRPGKAYGLRARLLYPLRKLLWTLLQPSIEHLVWRQNAVNRAMALALTLPSAGVSSRPPHVPPTADASEGNRARIAPSPVAAPARTPGTFHRVEQWLAGFSPGDAVSQDALAIRAAFEQRGIACDLLAPSEAIDQSGVTLCRSFSEHAAPTDDTGTLRIYHYSIGATLTQDFMALRGPRILRYHNITPATYFTGFDDRLAAQLQQGRDDLERAAAAADQVWAVSQFNAGDIQDAVPTPPAVLPLLFSPQRFDQAPDPGLRQRLRQGGFVNILFVGRIAPNKHLEDLIMAFDHYHRSFNPRSRLLIVGSTRSCPRYYGMLWMLTAALDNRAVCFEDFATDQTLNTYYQAADLFVSPSMHEGYGAPLVEAMAHGIPVLARHTGGTPEAMDGAGILFDHLSPPALAELMHATLSDATLRNRVLDAQADRITRWRQRDAAEEIQSRLNDGIQLSASAMVSR